MLSIENPPPDPQCPCEISQLNSSESHERPSDNKQQLGLDLSRFSIRDYVFKTRSKDIKTNWPFSPKNLQLCLKHGVTNLLPPFQSLDYARYSSTEKCDIGSVASDKESISNPDGKLSCSSDHAASVSYNNIGHGHKLSADCGDINETGSPEEREFPSTITSHSCSERDTVPTIQSTCLEAERKKFADPLTEKPVSSNKSENTIKETVKKCRLIVKLSNIADLRLQEDTGANTSVVSETMASKVCPVCKSFSSSSNTTLNAHIDQCLSGESAIKCTENPKVIKHRIKPKKSRLIVDVYATAKHFTLEDLDRRNGTNWASNMGFPAPNMEMSVEEKDETPSPTDVEDINDDAAVYIDSNGTKLRILSKFNVLQSNSNADDDCRPRKLEKRDKESKFSSSKKRNLIKKHKLMKCAPHGQNSCFPRHNQCHEIDDREQRNISPEESCEKDGFLTQPLETRDQMKLNNFGMMRQWVGSKRTGLMKKINGGNQHSDKAVTKDLRVKSHQSSLADPFLKRTSSLSSAILSDQNPQSPPESSKRQENLSLLSHDGCKDPSLRKRAEISLADSQSCHNEKKKRLMLSKCSVKQLRKDSPSVLYRTMDPPNCRVNHVPPQSNKRKEVLNPAKDSRSSFINSRSSQHHAYSSGGKKFSSLRNISLDHAFSSRGRKFSSLRKNELSVSEASIPDQYRKKLRRKFLDLKKPWVHYMSGSDEEALAPQSTIVRRHHMVDQCKNSTQLEPTDELFVDGTRVLKIRKKREALMVCRKEETRPLKRSQHSLESDSQVGKKIDSFTSESVPPLTPDDMKSSGKEVEISDDIVCEPIPDMADGGTFMVFSKSLDSNMQGLSQQYLEANKEPFLDKPILGGEEMFCGDEVGKLIITHNVHTVAELDTNEEPGNYFEDVDPIPIPGPPGSFLPSPGHMGSEDLHGHSSLTTCRVQSSEDEHELIDMDSSDSPVSAVSAICNSIATRSYSVSLEKSLEPDHGVQPETRSSFSRASIDPVVESSSPFEQAASAGEGNLNLDQSRTDLMFAESSPPRFKNSRPCCCSRKEGALSGVALNNQESQLSRRRTMSSLALPAVEKKMGVFAKRTCESLNSRSEIFSMSKSSSVREENIAKSSAGHMPMQFINSEVKSPTCDDYESAPPSISTPVLRLMGKNLVVNKDKDVCAETGPAPSSIMNDHVHPLSRVDNGVTSKKIHNEDHSLRHHTVSQVPITFDHLHFDVSSSNGSVNHGNHRTQLLSPRPLMPMLSNKNIGWSFPSSMGCRECKGGCNLTHEQVGSRIRVGTPITDDKEKVRTSSVTNQSVDPCCRARTEIIVIDDAPESEAVSVIKSTCNEGNTKVGGSTVGILASMGDSRHLNPLYHHLPQGYSLCRGSPIVQSASFQVPTSKGTSASPVKWNGTPGGSSALHSNSITASSTCKDHVSSTLYSSPHFS
ncbi:Hypothetical predicted protein [Olea europaea subsp. europaea]|uniref:Uncharacterized protein n=2 Tax=Olea europaea subsp. europaea TaxID=158383 RepID=A0A8S0RNL6_OLEEU|nr:Hypothetical predicted protein [Olea europaea subsp. europaea]